MNGTVGLMITVYVAPGLRAIQSTRGHDSTSMYRGLEMGKGCLAATGATTAKYLMYARAKGYEVGRVLDFQSAARELLAL